MTVLIPGIRSVLREAGCPPDEIITACIAAGDLVPGLTRLRERYRVELTDAGFKAAVLLTVEKIERERLGL
jgi:hypothetical protein